MIRFSIIMPVFNSRKTIKRSIESVLKQNFQEWELICIDDGSTDSSATYIYKIANGDKRIRVFRKKNEGPGKARNYGLQHAHGEYVAFLDSDDYWNESFLEAILAQIHNGNPDIVFYDFDYVTNRGIKICTVKLSHFKNHSKNDLLTLQMCGLFEWGMVKVIKRKLIVENNIIFGESHVGEEAIFSFDALRLAESFSFVSKSIYNYVDSEAGQHKKGDLDPWNSVVLSMQEHLRNLNIENNFNNGIRMLAMRACMIACYRCALQGSIKEAIGTIEKTIDYYIDIYSIDKTDFSLFDRNNKILAYLICKKQTFLIYFLSKVRSVVT